MHGASKRKAEAYLLYVEVLSERHNFVVQIGPHAPCRGRP
jgi:hypothetical protein